MGNMKLLREVEERFSKILRGDAPEQGCTYTGDNYRADASNLIVGHGFSKKNDYYSLHSGKDDFYKFFPFTQSLPNINRFLDANMRRLPIRDSDLAPDGSSPLDCVITDVFGPDKGVVVLTHYRSISDMKSRRLKSSNIIDSAEILSKHDFAPDVQKIDYEKAVANYEWQAAKERTHPLKVCLKKGLIGTAPSGYMLFSPRHLFKKSVSIEAFA